MGIFAGNRAWLCGTVAAAAVVFLGALVGAPDRLAKSERLDPLFQTERLISRGDYGSALRLLSRAAEEGLDLWGMRRVVLQRAVCQRFLGRYGRALADFRSVKEGFRDIEDYLVFWQGECYEGLNQPDSAISCYARVVQFSPPSLLRDSAALRAADLRLAQGCAEEAIGFYESLLDRSDQEGTALMGLADAYLASGDSARARDVSMRLVRDYPGSPRALDALARLQPLEGVAEHFYGGVAYGQNGGFRKAATHLQEIVRHASDRHWRGRAQYELGHVYYGRKHYRTAERAFEKAYRVYHVPKALFDLGRCSVRLGKDKEAVERFQSFARLYPSIPGASEALWNAAMAYGRQGMYRQAREVFSLLASRYPRSFYADDARWRAGFALYRMGHYEDAAQDFLRLGEAASETYMQDQGFFWAGKCYQKLGREEDGGRYMHRAAEGFPASYYSTRARAVLGLNSRVYPEVTEAVSKEIKAEYELSVYLLKGDQLASLGLYRQSEREYRRAERVHGNNLFALDDLLQRYERIRAMNPALQVSSRIISLEQQRGIPMTLASFRRLYPTYYWGEISRAAQEMDLDPSLILAIIRQESAFNEEALSPVGARGLMQVMPTTGRHMARRVQMAGFSADDLWKPQVSIRLGARHLSDHLRYFGGADNRQLGLALSAYNAGLKAARRWSKRLSQKDVDEFVESIPYKETRKYVKLVYRNYQVYSYLQGDQPLQIEHSVH